MLIFNFTPYYTKPENSTILQKDEKRIRSFIVTKLTKIEFNLKIDYFKTHYLLKTRANY
jgi:hypothetical protein